MQVRAKAITGQKYSGEYNHRRRVPGEVFTLNTLTRISKDGKKIVISPEAQFSDKWMERVDPKAQAKQQPIEQPASEEIQGDDVI